MTLGLHTIYRSTDHVVADVAWLVAQRSKALVNLSAIETVTKMISRKVNAATSIPRDAVIARYLLSSCYCLSVRPSVCLSAISRYCVKTAKHRITQSAPHDSPGTTIVFWRQRCLRNSTGVTPSGSTNTGGIC